MRCAGTMAALAAALACGGTCAEPSWRIPPVTATMEIAGQAVRIAVSGSVSASPPSGGLQAVAIVLDADLADFQRHLTPILAAQLNQANRCGERLNVLDAALAPAAPAAQLTVRAHVEKWACAKALGKEIVKRLVGGDARIGVRLTPQVDAGLRLAAEVTSMDAEGSLGELLRPGPFADAIREKIRATVVSAIQKATDFQSAIPASVLHDIALREARFTDAGGGKLGLTVSGEARMPASEARALLERLPSQPR